MLKKLQNASIQFKILMLFIVMGSLLTFTFGATFYQNTLESALDNKERELVSLADITANKIERYLFERTGDAKVLAQSNIFITPEISKAIRINYLENVMRAYQAYDGLYVMDSKGEIQLFVGDQQYHSLPTNLILQFLNPQGYTSDIMTSDKQERFIYFAFPILDGEQLSGAIVERMNFNAIDEILSSIQIGNTGYAIIEESNKHDHHGTLDTVRINGTEYFSASAPLIQYPGQSKEWHVTVLQHRNEAMAVKHDIEKYISYIIITSLILFLGISYFISRRITRPIKNLMQKTSMLMKSNQTFASDVVVSDEVKTLASSFDVLLEELHFMMQQVLEKSGEAAYIKEIRHSIDSLFDHMPNGIVTIDAKGRISSINAVALEILDVSESNLLHKHIKHDIPRHLVPLLDMVHHTLTSDQIYHNEVFRLKHQSGHIIPIIFSTLRQMDLHNNLIGITLMINNFDAKRSFDESIFRAKKLAELGELSAGVAHEIRNPLASIKGYAQVALLEVKEQTQLKDDLQVILSEVDRLEGILDRFMTFARPNAPTFTRCHLNDIIKETIDQVRKGMQLGNINLRHRYTKQDVIHVDCNQIKQVLINLILNAIQALPKGGQIDLVTVLNDNGDMMEIHIVDNGDGISPEVQKKIFSPFFTTRDNGTGLGLAICSRIIENHKGIIEVKSEINQGTQVIIRLPLEKGNM